MKPKSLDTKLHTQLNSVDDDFDAYYRNFSERMIDYSGEIAQPEEDEPQEKSCFNGTQLNYSLLFAVLFVFFSFSVGWSLIETIITPIARDNFGMDVTSKP